MPVTGTVVPVVARVATIEGTFVRTLRGTLVATWAGTLLLPDVVGWAGGIEPEVVTTLGVFAAIVVGVEAPSPVRQPVRLTARAGNNRMEAKYFLRIDFKG